ncbi:MAG: hypothetical protein ABI680_14310 [Chthoniobacteraceae bacterium]
MRKRTQRWGFTLCEAMISMSMSLIIIAALVSGSIGLQRALHLSEVFADNFSDQRRIIDYVSRDLRRSIGIAVRDRTSGAEHELVAGSVEITEDTALLLTVPGYYKSNVPADADYGEALPPVTTDDGPIYGDATGAAPSVPIIYRRTLVAAEGSTCLVREEAGALQVIVRNAQDFHLSVAVDAKGSRCTIQGAYGKSARGVTSGLATVDAVMLRNPRTD